MIQPLPRDQWSPDLVRELLVVIYGGRLDTGGVWHPDVREVARRRRVSPRTVQRWIRRGSDLTIPAAHLEAMTQRRRPRRRTLRREELQAERTRRILERAQLGRRRGNVDEYADRGWLDQHVVLIIEDGTRPLRRVTVVRDEPGLRRRAARGARVVDFVIADSKFTADAVRYEILQALTPWRLELPATKVPRGHTQVWLSSAPLPTTPLHTTIDTWMSRDVNP